MGEKIKQCTTEKERNGTKSTYIEKVVLVSVVTVSQFENILP